MRSPRLWAALCLLLTASCRLCAAARYGCLFEKKLCPRDQLCNDDGLFGQCQAPHQEPVQYQVSVPALHKLQEVLKDLMVQGLTWRDDVTQAIISRELSKIPTVGASSELHEKTPKQASRLPGSGQQRVQGPEDPADPELMQQYVDYMILDPSRSSVHMQTPLMDPYTYHQQYGYQEEEERSLNSLDDNPAFPLLASPSRSRSRGNPLDRDRQLLQDLVSFYLTSPSSSSSSSSSASSSSSSSSPVQSLSRHRGAVAAAAAAAAGFPSSSSSSSSSSSFLPELDFPLDYGEDYVSQMSQLRKQQQQEQAEKKAQKEYNTLSGLDESSLQRLALLLDHYGLDMKDLSPEQKDNVPAALKQLQLESSYAHKQTKDKYGNSAVTGKKVTEGSLVNKMVAHEAPPSTAKSSRPEAPDKETTPTVTSNQDKLGKMEPANKAEEYGYIVTNQSVVGPAVTFRIRPNSKNLTAGDVAKTAVAEKNFLESETGLKVLQSGVGERNDGKALPLADPSPAGLPLGVCHAGGHGLHRRHPGGRHDHRLPAPPRPPTGGEEARPGAGGRQLQPPGVPGERVREGRKTNTGSPGIQHWLKQRYKEFVVTIIRRNTGVTTHACITGSPGPVSPAHGLQRRLRTPGSRRPGCRGRSERRRRRWRSCRRRGRRWGSGGGGGRRRRRLEGEQRVVPVQRRSPAQP
uniref:Uncharacterized protein n=1 Tax=Lates calcarifer TaxID=8187 RepID=A0A4W6ERL2_LATCA